MTGTVAQAITLSTYGTAFLKNNFDISSLTLMHPTFQFDNSVNFIKQRKRLFRKPQWIIYAANPIEWLQKLKEEGCISIRLVHEADNSNELNVPDHKLASFVGGGGFNYLEAVYKTHSDFWMARQEVTNREAKDDRIWSVTYGCIYPKQPKVYSPVTYDIFQTTESLKSILDRVNKFAKEHCPYWSETFQKALNYLHADSPYHNESDKLIVPNELFPPKSLQLLASAATAWVFGGMGSWNDISFKDEEVENLYESLSEELYDNLNKAYACGANSFLPDKK